MGELHLRRLGRSGLAVSAAGLGCNNLGRAGTITRTQDESTAVVQAALDAGITLFDTADVYGAEPGLSEVLLGRALGSRRADAIVATKFGMDARGANGPDFGARGSRRYVRAAVEASLGRLGTDWIDLYQLHTPDPATPIEETIAALDELVAEGKVRYIGHSNFTGWQLVDAEWSARTQQRTRFISAQNEYSLLERDPERELVPAAVQMGVGILPYFPLANGLLTGKYSRDRAQPGTRLGDLKPGVHADAPWDVLEALAGWVQDRGLTMLEVAFGWLLAQPAVASVIAGATRPEQVRANAAAAGTELTQADLAAIEEVVRRPGQ